MNITPTTLFGFLLSVLDFCGFDNYLEQLLWKFHVWARELGRKLTARFWKLEFPFNFFVGLMTVSLLLNFLSLIGFLLGRSELPPMVTDAQRGGLFEAVFMITFTVLLLPFMIGLILWFLWYPLKLMSMTPRGIVGSLGLIIAILGFFE